MDSILLTGSTGFIGSNLARYWQKKYDIWHILRKTSLKDDRLFDVPVKHVLYWEDIASTPLPANLPPFSACYHLAVAGNVPTKQNIPEMITGNINQFINLIDFCKAAKVKKLIHFSSWSEYGNHGEIPLKEDMALNPDYLYGASKASGYLLAKAYAKSVNLPLLSLRLFSLFGRYDKPYNLIPSLIKASLFKLLINLTPGYQKRDFVSLDSVFSLLDIIQMDKEARDGVFNVCSGQGTTLRSIGEKIQSISGIDNNLFRWGAKPYRLNEAMYIVGDPEKTYKQFGWKASIDLDSDLQDLFTWYEANLEWLDN